jgi:hypothetical protein
MHHRSRGSELLNLPHFGSEDSKSWSTAAPLFLCSKIWVVAWSAANPVNIAQQECSVSTLVCLASGHPLHHLLIHVFAGFRAVRSVCYLVFLGFPFDILFSCSFQLRLIPSWTAPRT